MTVSVAPAADRVRSRLRDPELFRDDLFVDGAWVASSDAARLEVVDPADGLPLGSVASATRDDVRRAIDAAASALPAWSALSAKERSAILRRWFDLMVESADDLAVILTAEQGKPLAEAKGEILYGAAFVDWYAEEAKRIYGETIPANTTSRRMLVLKQPIGVCAAITPWNFPMAMITRKAGPALAAGCTMVLKPASATPFSALALAELARRAGVPPGVFAVVPGASSVVGDELARNATVRKLTFTGSTEVGRELMAKCAGTIKKVSLELGGNAPLLVFDDADLDAAVDGAIASKFRNTGQTCVCANRLLVQDGIHDAFVERLSEAVRALNVGNGFEDGVEQGPLIDDHAVAKVEEHIADALAQGAAVAAGGARHELGGTFFEPTVITGATPGMRVAHEETFGPLAPVFRFGDEAEAIELANATEFGLAAYLFTRDVGRVWRVGEALEFGIVGVNTGVFSYEGAPFGGVKQSGIGREGSRHGIDEFLELKYLCLDGIDR
ncbi:MAG TPA: NAD-dependent succinate-semialdehyde dehydrogenase [Gaiella sp.]|jgi:succinate-semialdehyde dehydrogenase/glutarate-semialdehyde dehydrogenase|nr:NAD-dependent succinate-semialdehyde dehydrogenase [Gaiella sp.]